MSRYYHEKADSVRRQFLSYRNFFSTDKIQTARSNFYNFLGNEKNDINPSCRFFLSGSSAQRLRLFWFFSVRTEKNRKVKVFRDQNPSKPDSGRKDRCRRKRYPKCPYPQQRLPNRRKHRYSRSSALSCRNHGMSRECPL